MWSIQCLPILPIVYAYQNRALVACMTERRYFIWRQTGAIGGVNAGDMRLSETAAPPTGAGKFFKEKVLDSVVLPIDRGANTQVYLAAAADAGGDLTKRGGLYFDVMAPAKANAAATDKQLAKDLWALSEKLSGVTFLDEGKGGGKGDM